MAIIPIDRTKSSGNIIPINRNNAVVSQDDKVSQVNDLIGKRESFIDINNPITMDSMKKNFIGESLRGLLGGFQLTEAIPADIALTLQNPQSKEVGFSKLGENLTNDLLGKRVPQIGDVYRASNLPVISNEAFASTAGLLTAGLPYTPSGALGEVTAKAVAPAASVVTNLSSKFGAPVVGKAIAFLTGRPENEAIKAVQNPQFLSKSWIKNEGKLAGELYQKHVAPVIDDATKRVNTSGLNTVVDDLKLYTSTGEPTSQITKMKPTEVKKVTNWIKEIQKGDMSFNRANAILGEMDNGLQKVYKNYAKDKLEPITTAFEGVTTKLRGALNEVRRAQYPDLVPYLDKYSNFKTAQTVFQNFESMRPHFSVALGVSSIAPALIGQAANPAVYPAMFLATISKFHSTILNAARIAVEGVKRRPGVALGALAEASR